MPNPRHADDHSQLTLREVAEAKVAWALWFIERGAAILPLHHITGFGTDELQCSCRGFVKQCKPGKHPRANYRGQPLNGGDEGRRGVNGATRDVDVVRHWFELLPQMNYGVATGPHGSRDSGIDVWDIDVNISSGVPIDEAFRQRGLDYWSVRTGDQLEPSIVKAKMPEEIFLARVNQMWDVLREIDSGALAVRTGGGGMHFFFRATGYGNPPPMPGSDWRGDGGYVVGPWSRHVSGEYYKPVVGARGSPMLRPPDIYELRAVPEALMTLLSARSNGICGRDTVGQQSRQLGVAAGRTPRTGVHGYAEPALEEVVYSIELAPRGNLRASLRRGCRRLAALCVHGLIDEDVFRDAICSAVARREQFLGTGVTSSSEARELVNWCLNAARANPGLAPEIKWNTWSTGL